MLRLRQGGRGHQLRHGDGEPPLPGRGGGAGQRAGLEMPADTGGPSAGARARREKLLAINKQAARTFHKWLYEPEGAQGLEYLRKRGLSQRTPHPLRPGVRPQPVGRPHRGAGPGGVRQAGPAGRGAGGEQQGRPHLRPVPQPGHVPHYRHPGRGHRLRRPGDGRLHPQVPELPGHPGVQQEPQRVRPEHRQKVQGGAGHPHRGVYGHHLPASGGV